MPSLCVLGPPHPKQSVFYCYKYTFTEGCFLSSSRLSFINFLGWRAFVLRTFILGAFVPGSSFPAMAWGTFIPEALVPSIFVGFLDLTYLEPSGIILDLVDLQDLSALQGLQDLKCDNLQYNTVG